MFHQQNTTFIDLYHKMFHVCFIFTGYIYLLCVYIFCRYLQRVVAHPSLLQDPDVREFLERDEVTTFIIFLDTLYSIFCGGTF